MRNRSGARHPSTAFWNDARPQAGRRFSGDGGKAIRPLAQAASRTQTMPRSREPEQREESPKVRDRRSKNSERRNAVSGKFVQRSLRTNEDEDKLMFRFGVILAGRKQTFEVSLPFES